jgi:tRNA nucleotidyltransferase (CCA-adding enzyme)
VKPSEAQRTRVHDLAERIKRKVQGVAQKRALPGEVRLDGSVAKDTWLSNQVDLDIFLRLPPEIPKESLAARCIPIAREALSPSPIIERYAEHPYAEAYVEDVRVNIVPCYNVSAGEWRSATDRTPFHTDYIRSHLGDAERDQVRLLKAFMTGIGTYGADIKTGGFSGMLCETFVVAKRSFRSVVTEASDWKPGVAVDVERYYEGRSDEISDLFSDELVVIDPVDKGRNLAASVTRRRLWQFVSAARLLLAHPSLRFFFPPPIRPATSPEIRRMIRDRNFVGVAVGRIDAVVDILWSQLYRTENALSSHLKSSGFEIVQSASWSNEKDLSVILFEMATDPLGAVYLHDGPEVSRRVEATRFIQKHVKAGETVAGPWIQGNRWFAARSRRTRHAKAVLTHILRSQRNQELGVARRVSHAARKTGRVLTNTEILTLCGRNHGFAEFLIEFLQGRPRWLSH